MASPNLRTASLALDQARPVVARLDIARNPEDVAADIIESWSAAETALRALVGGSSLTGQALVKELRQREQLTLEQGHALLAFLGARDRVARTEYRPTGADVAAAREGFQRLEAAVSSGPLGGGMPTPSAYATPVVVDATPAPVDATRRRVPILPLVLGFLLLAAAATAAWWFLDGRASGSMEDGMRAYRAGRTNEARAHFAAAVRNDPDQAEPHVFLARMARDEGNLPGAQSELQAALRVEPNNALALREMGAYQYTVGNYELAQRFYAHSLRADGNNREAMGFMACSLYKLGRIEPAQRFFQRAGQGPWTACIQQGPPPGAGYPQPQRVGP